MRRFVRWVVGLAGLAIALPVALVIGVLVWACSALPDDMSPPDPSTVPESVRMLFWVEFGGGPEDARVLESLRLLPLFPAVRDPGSRVSGYAAKLLMFREERRIRQLRFALAELIGSRWIAWRWTAEEALAEIALSSYFGHGFRGVHAASLGYFGKPVEQLTVSQVAALVAITKAPSGYSPWCHPDRLAKRITVLIAPLPEQNASSALEGLLPSPAGACRSE